MFTLRTTGIIIIINTAIIHNTITPGKNIKIPHLLKFTSMDWLSTSEVN